MHAERGAPRWLWPAIVVLAAVPVALHWYYIARWPSMRADDARELTWRLENPGVLVDVRQEGAFEANHLLGSDNWPLDDVRTLALGDTRLNRYFGKKVLIISQSGVDGAAAVRVLRPLGVDAVNVAGGMESWMAAARRPCAVGLLRRERGEDVDMRPFFFRPMPRREQWAAVIGAFVVKPLYMLTAFALILVLRRRRSSDLRVVRASLVFFLAGETFCALNYAVFENGSLLFDYLHNVLMPCAFGLAVWGVLEGVDRRMIKYGEPGERCAALGLCRGCSKYDNMPCGLQRLFLIIIPVMMALSFIPLAAKTRMMSYNTAIFHVVYSYNHPVLLQLQEIRYLPVVALVFLAASLAVLLLKRRDPVPPSKALFAVGMGALGFSMLRLVFYQMYYDAQVWASFWEEVTEFMFASGVAFTLWTFRRGLMREEAPAAEPVQPDRPAGE